MLNFHFPTHGNQYSIGVGLSQIVFCITITRGLFIYLFFFSIILYYKILIIVPYAIQ